jgi:hypothetical protein
VRDGHPGADREQADRREHRPHVDLAAVAERVRPVGGPVRAPLRDEQEHLVAGVRPGVRGLRQHGGGAGQHGGDGLGRRDQAVGREGDDDGERALGVRLGARVRGG